MASIIRHLTWSPKRLAADVASASILGFVGDVVCQLAVERRRSPKEIADLDITKPSRSGEEFDVRHLASLTFFSGAYIGCFLHVLYQLYSPAVLFVAARLPPSSLKQRLVDTSTLTHAFGCACVDNVHNGGLYTPAYFIGVGLLQGDGWHHAKDNLKAEWLTTYLSCTGFWVPFMWANFRFCPPANRVQAMAAGNLVWNVVIDHLAHRGGDDKGQRDCRHQLSSSQKSDTIGAAFITKEHNAVCTGAWQLLCFAK